MEKEREDFDILKRGLERVTEAKKRQEERETVRTIVTQEALRKPGNSAWDLELELERIKQLELKPRIYIFFNQNKEGFSFTDMRDGSPSVNDANEDKYVTTLEDISIVKWNDEINVQKDTTRRASRTIDKGEEVYEAITYIVTKEEFETIIREILLSDDPKKIEISVPRVKYNNYDDFVRIRDEASKAINMGYNIDDYKEKSSKVAVGDFQTPNESFIEINKETLPRNDTKHEEDIIDLFFHDNKLDPTGNGGFGNNDSHKGIK